MIIFEGAATIDSGPQANYVNVSLDVLQGRCLISEKSASTTGGGLGLYLATKDSARTSNPT